jgi:hypothetical protein
MTSEQFRNTLLQRPFRPFKIRMADGRSFDVTHPEFVALTQSGRAAIVAHPDDSYSILDLPLMSELQIANGRESGV